MSFKKVFVLLLFFAVVGFVYLNFGTGDNVIAGADDFKIESPFSEDNYKFKENNDENHFIANDFDGNMLSIERLSDAEFNDIKNTIDFMNDSNCSDSISVSHEVTVVDSSIPYLYKSMYINDMIYEKDVQVYLIEIVEVNNTKYKIMIGNTGKTINDDNYDGFDIKGWEDYLIKFNEINKLKNVLKVDLSNSVSDTADSERVGSVEKDDVNSGGGDEWTEDVDLSDKAGYDCHVYVHHNGDGSKSWHDCDGYHTVSEDEELIF